jgi:hypothetical protein
MPNGRVEGRFVAERMAEREDVFERLTDHEMNRIVDVEPRRSWKRQLLFRYLERMRDSSGLTTPLYVAFDQYRCQLFAALLMWTLTLCHPPTMPDMQPPEMSREMIRRMTTAIDDLDALDVKGVSCGEPSRSANNFPVPMR